LIQVFVWWHPQIAALVLNFFLNLTPQTLFLSGRSRFQGIVKGTPNLQQYASFISGPVGPCALRPFWIRTWVAAQLWRTWRHWYGSHHGWIVSSKWWHKWRRRPTKLMRWSRMKHMRHLCFRSVGKSARNIIKENDTCVGQLKSDQGTQLTLHKVKSP